MALQVVTVSCPKCTRSFRTLATVIEVASAGTCPRCRVPMRVGRPQPLSVLAQRPKGIRPAHKKK